MANDYGLTALTASLQESHSQFSAELRLIQDRVDSHTASVRELSSQQKQLSAQLDAIQTRIRQRQERKQKIQNLKRAVGEMRGRGKQASQHVERVQLGEADVEFSIDAAPQHPMGADIPSSQVLQARLNAYNSLNARLAAHLTSLRARDSELEAKYRRVIALCTGVAESQVDNVLGQLVQGVESEGDPSATGQDVGRVREFLRRVEMVI